MASKGQHLEVGLLLFLLIFSASFSVAFQMFKKRLIPASAWTETGPRLVGVASGQNKITTCAISCSHHNGQNEEHCYFVALDPNGACVSGIFDPAAAEAASPTDPLMEVYGAEPELQFGVFLGVNTDINDTTVIGPNGRTCPTNHLPANPKPTPSSIYMGGAAYGDGHIYLCGGIEAGPTPITDVEDRTGAAVDVCYSLDLSDTAASWTPIASMDSPRKGQDLFYHEGKLITGPGSKNDGPDCGAEAGFASLDTTGTPGATWDALDTPAELDNQFFYGSAQDGSNIYIVGGRSCVDDTLSQTVLRFKIASGSFEVIGTYPSGPVADTSCSIVHFSGARGMLCLGGFTNFGRTGDAQFLRLDGSDTWGAFFVGLPSKRNNNPTFALAGTSYLSCGGHLENPWEVLRCVSWDTATKNFKLFEEDTLQGPLYYAAAVTVPWRYFPECLPGVLGQY